MIESSSELSITEQCDLLGINRTSYYYKSVPESSENLLLMKEIDKIYTEDPAYGSRMITACLKRNGFEVNRKKVSRLMRLMAIEAIFPRVKVRTTIPGNIRFPYLLKDLEIIAKNQAWQTDITYIPTNEGFVYLVAYVDVYSRYIVGWSISNNLEADFCIQSFEKALIYGCPEIINSDQGCQYTSKAYLEALESKKIRVSMSAKGRCWDNIYAERFWRTLKYEEVFLNEYEDFFEAERCICEYIKKYNTRRPHSSLEYKTPAEVYFSQ
jgi:putative transposase